MGVWGWGQTYYCLTIFLLAIRHCGVEWRWGGLLILLTLPTLSTQTAFLYPSFFQNFHSLSLSLPPPPFPEVVSCLAFARRRQLDQLPSEKKFNWSLSSYHSGKFLCPDFFLNFLFCNYTCVYICMYVCVFCFRLLNQIYESFCWFNSVYRWVCLVSIDLYGNHSLDFLFLIRSKKQAGMLDGLIDWALSSNSSIYLISENEIKSVDDWFMAFLLIFYGDLFIMPLGILLSLLLLTFFFLFH